LNGEVVRFFEVAEGKIKSLSHCLIISTMSKQLGPEIAIKEETKEIGTNEAPARVEMGRVHVAFCSIYSSLKIK